MRRDTGWKYFLVTAIAVFLSFELHELCHFLAGESLGNKMAWTLNSGYPVSGHYKNESDYNWISAAGPAFTILQGLIFFLLLRRKDNHYLYPFLFSAFFLRFFAMILGFSRLNDEARISHSLGIGSLTLPLLVSTILFLPVLYISKKYAYSKRFQAITIGYVILFYSMIILTDKYFHIRIL